MKKLTLALVIIGMIMLSGCSELGIENPVAQENTLVVHNQTHTEGGAEGHSSFFFHRPRSG